MNEKPNEGSISAEGDRLASEPAEQTTDQPAEQPAEQPGAPGAGAARTARTRWRDRTLGFKGVLATALAGVIVGGLGGTAVGFLLDDGDDGGRAPGRHGRPFDSEGGRGAVPPARQGVPPTTAPEEQESAGAS